MLFHMLKATQCFGFKMMHIRGKKNKRTNSISTLPSWLYSSIGVYLLCLVVYIWVSLDLTEAGPTMSGIFVVALFFLWTFSDWW